MRTAQRAAVPIDPCGCQHDLGGQLRDRARHAQVIPHGEPAGQVVQLADDVHAGVELARDGGDRVTAPDAVVVDPETLIGGELLQVLAEYVGRIHRQQEVMRTRGVGRPAMEGGVQLVELLGTDPGDLGGDLEVHLGVRRDAREVGRIRNGAELEPIGLRIPHQAFHRQELGHVGARLPGQPQVPEGHRTVGGAVHVHGALHHRLAAVVRGDRQQPVAVELIVQALQVVEGCARGLHDVAPAVVPPVLLQAIVRAGTGNELPQSRSARARVGVRLERALHHRQERELERHATTLQLGDDLIQVQVRAPEGPLQIIRVRGVPAQLLIDRSLTRTVIELEARAHPIEQVPVLIRRKSRKLRRRGVRRRGWGGCG